MTLASMCGKRRLIPQCRGVYIGKREASFVLKVGPGVGVTKDAFLNLSGMPALLVASGREWVFASVRRRCGSWSAGWFGSLVY